MLLTPNTRLAQEIPDEPPYGDEDDSDEEDFDLRDVSSDVEMDPTAMDIPSDDEAEAAYVLATLSCLVSNVSYPDLSQRSL
jgi:hypothetical protein